MRFWGRTSFLVYVLAFFLLLTVASQPTTAANPRVLFRGFYSYGCDAYSGPPSPGETALRVRFSNTNGTFYFSTLVRANGQTYMDWFFNSTLSGTGFAIWGLGNQNSRGLQTATFPLPENTPITVILRLNDSNRRFIDGFRLRYICNTGEVLSVQRILR